MQYHIALIIGRFQPFHNGHLYLLKKTLLIAEKVIFGIGSASIYDENNPLSYEQRKIMIETVVKNEKISDRVVKIIPLEDFNNDKKWLKNLCKQVGGFDIAMGNNEWTNKILEKAGYKIIKVNHYKRYLYEGWRIRRLIKEKKPWKNRVPNYIVPLIHGFIAKNNNGTMKQFNNVVLGGTFDHFHAGHKALLKKAFELGKKVTIGIATEELYKDKFLSETIEPFKIRKKSVREFLNKNNWLSRTRLISFSDFKGSSDKMKNINAIVVSRLTYPNALKINQLREKNKLFSLRIIIINDVLADDGKLISSERIRMGEINRSGKVSLDFFKKTLVLSESFKEELRKPMGKVFKTVHKVIKFIKSIKPIMTIAVGDIIVDSMLKSGIEPDIKIIDFRSRRKKIKGTLFYKDSLSRGQSFFMNKPGTINLKTARKLKEIIQKTIFKKQKSWLVVDGEEDLLALPAILFAPLNSLVLYGHWQYGVIAVKITEEIKIKAFNLLKKIS